MKFAHFSDLHFCSKNREESGRCFGTAVELAIEAKASLAVISGDLIDHRLSANDPALHDLIKIVRRLAYEMPVFILQGTYSHDAIGTLNIFRSIKCRNDIYVSDKEGEQVVYSMAEKQFFKCGYDQSKTLDDSMILISGFPPYNKAQAAAINSKDVNQVAAIEVSDVLKSFLPLNLEAKNLGIPTILVTHGTLVGSITEHGVPMSGSDHEFSPVSLSSAGARFVMLGHIHKHQHWIERDSVIAYAGSIGRFHEGEQDGKGFLVWDTETVASNDVPFELVLTPASKSLAIEFEGTPDTESLQRSAESALDPGYTSVRIRYHVDEEHRRYVDHQHIEEIFAQFMSLKIEPIVSPIIRTRAEGFNKSTTMPEKITHWASIADVEPAGPVACWEQLIAHEDVTLVVQEVLQ